MQSPASADGAVVLHVLDDCACAWVREACGGSGETRGDVHFQSVGFCATATTLTRISSSVMLGTGTSCTPAVLPGWVIRAFIVFGTETAMLGVSLLSSEGELRCGSLRVYAYALSPSSALPLDLYAVREYPRMNYDMMTLPHQWVRREFW